MGKFSKAFVDLRSRSGFKTGYAFYTANGGRRTFPFTYGYYIKIERGERLPSPRELLLLFRNLRRGPSLVERHALARALLRDLSGDDSVYDDLFAGLSTATPEAEYMTAIRDLHGRLSYDITAAQLKVIASTPAATRLFTLLSNVSDAVPLDEIAASLRIPAGECAAALRELRKAKLCRCVGKDAWEGPNPGGCYRGPASPATATPRARIAENLRQFAREGGHELLNAYFTQRLKLFHAQSAVARMQEVLESSAGFEQSRAPRGPDTPVYLIEARVTRLFETGGGRGR